MRSVADQIDVIRPYARLQRAMPSSIRFAKARSDSLHPTTDEKRRVIDVRHDVTIDDQGEAELLESALNYFKRAKRGVISLSSIPQRTFA